MRAALNKQTEAENSRNLLAKKLSELREESKKLESSGADIVTLRNRKKELETRAADYREFLGELADMSRQEILLEEKQRIYIEANREYEKLRGDYELKNLAFLNEQAGIIASSLSEGVPCPVCGSVNHPALASVSENAPTESDVKAAKILSDAAQNAMISASGDANAQKGIVSSAKENILRKISVLLEEIAFENAASAAKAKIAVLTDKILETDGLLSKALGDEERKKEIDEKTIPQKELALRNAEKDSADFKILSERLSADIENIKKRTNELRAKFEFPERKSALSEKEKLEQKLFVLKTGFESAQNAYNSLDREIERLCGTIKELEKQISSGCSEDISVLEKEKDETETKLREISNLKKSIDFRIGTNSSAIKNISEKSAEIEKLDKHYRMIKALSDTANGSVPGKDKIMLETYIQATYFDRILERANIRLQKMSGGQYDLKRRANALNMRSQSGLELDIVDHINATERSVNTLSGGESFLASLALALGLSDEVQMSTGIHLDTLFVDEGFGSLDSEALNKAYSTLAGLTEGNRLVGIISHVSELKERIDKQIIVTKDKSGGSSAKVVI
ncbi:MAG: SMC family ATPase [Oscillospiraceae bacterium]|nr:SMC family ATPase [Oscillospiraceae bacterium]